MKKPLYKEIILIILLTILSIVCIAAIPLTKYPINLISYILLALFLPGYAFMAVVYPLKNDIGSYKRIFGSILVSLFLTIILILLTRYKILVIDISSIFLIIAILTIVLLVAAFYRSYKFKNSESPRMPPKTKNSSIRFSDAILNWIIINSKYHIFSPNINNDIF